MKRQSLLTIIGFVVSGLIASGSAQADKPKASKPAPAATSTADAKPAPAKKADDSGFTPLGPKNDLAMSNGDGLYHVRYGGHTGPGCLNLPEPEIVSGLPLYPCQDVNNAWHVVWGAWWGPGFDSVTKPQIVEGKVRYLGNGQCVANMEGDRLVSDYLRPRDSSTCGTVDFSPTSIGYQIDVYNSRGFGGRYDWSRGGIVWYSGSYNIPTGVEGGVAGFGRHMSSSLPARQSHGKTFTSYKVASGDIVVRVCEQEYPPSNCQIYWGEDSSKVWSWTSTPEVESGFVWYQSKDEQGFHVVVGKTAGKGYQSVDVKFFVGSNPVYDAQIAKDRHVIVEGVFETPIQQLASLSKVAGKVLLVARFPTVKRVGAGSRL